MLRFCIKHPANVTIVADTRLQIKIDYFKGNWVLFRFSVTEFCFSWARPKLQFDKDLMDAMFTPRSLELKSPSIARIFRSCVGVEVLVHQQPHHVDPGQDPNHKVHCVGALTCVNIGLHFCICLHCVSLLWDVFPCRFLVWTSKWWLARWSCCKVASQSHVRHLFAGQQPCPQHCRGTWDSTMVCMKDPILGPLVMYCRVSFLILQHLSFQKADIQLQCSPKSHPPVDDPCSLFHRRLSLRSLRSVQRWTKVRVKRFKRSIGTAVWCHFMTFHDVRNHSYDWKSIRDSVALAGAESMHPLLWYRQVRKGSYVHGKHVEQNGSRRVMAEFFEMRKLHWRDTLADDSIKINHMLTKTLLVSTRHANNFGAFLCTLLIDLIQPFIHH